MRAKKMNGFNNQHFLRGGRGDLYDHLLRKTTFTLMMCKIFIQAPKFTRNTAMEFI